MSCSYSALWIVIVCLARLGTFAYGEVKRECAKVTTWTEFVDTIQNSSDSDKVMFCPFSVQHNGESSSGFKLPSGKTIICQKLNAMDQCIIQGDSRHFDISSNTLIGFTFSSSIYSAVMLDGAQTRVDFIGCNFVNNVRLDGGDGGAITTNNTVKDEPADTGTSTIFIALSTFIANGAPFGHGGAMFTTDSQVMVISSDFINNSANIGGAIAIKNGSFRDTTFTYNHSNDAFTSSGYSISLNTCSIGYNLGCNFKECDGIYSGGSICKKFETVCEYPSTQPTKASSRPSSSPSLRRSLAPSISSSHSAKPTDIPTFLLTESLSKLPTIGPSSSTTMQPSTERSESPSIISMPSPTLRNVPPSYSAKPAESPSLVPTDSPSSTSSIHVPTILTLPKPSGLPSIIASHFPSLSRVFTSSPSSILTDTEAPSLMPILSPTINPSVAESGSPSISSPSPSNKPSLSLTVKPKFVCENLLDSKDEFNVSFELGVRTCDWVMRSSDTVETCAIPIVEKNCPVTCSVDCINDQGIWSKAEQSTDEKYKKDKKGSLKRNIIIISLLTLLFVAGVSYYIHNKWKEDDASELGFMDLFRAFSFENFFRMIGYDRSMGSSSSSSSSKNSYISDDESSTSSSSSPVASHVSSHDRFFFPRKTAKSFVSISKSPSSTSDAKPASSLCCA